MPDTANLAVFAMIALGMALTPGPNMIYLVSRSISQGPRAGLISLCGIAAGFVIYMLCAALGITAIVMAVPFAYDALRFAGAAYLLWLAWGAVRPGGRSAFAVRDLPRDGPRRLFLMGLFTNLLNPKIAVMYLSLLPQFVDPAHGSVLGQTLALGTVQIAISLAVNGCLVVGAGAVARFLVRRPGWAAVQRWIMGSVLAALAVRMATEARR